jgi:prepilin-type N-terminal cleavage/methylation domain-containing protein
MYSRNGFTLVELVLAVVITSIAVYALLIVFTTATYKNVDLEYLGKGLYLANGKLEEVGSRRYSSITNEAWSPFEGDFSDFNSMVEFCYVSPEALDVPIGTDFGYKKITVRVTSSHLTSSIEVSTLVTDVSNE